MATAAVLDLEGLLRPIDEERPAGRDVATDPEASALYHELKDARNAARTSERYAILETEAEAPDWRPVLELAPRILAEHCKHLDVCVWLTEALCRTRGFAGLRDGFALARGLIEKFWDDLHPEPDEDGLATRVAALAGLNGVETDGTLIAPIALVPITAGITHGPFASFHYDQARALSRIEDDERRQQRIEAGQPSMEMFQSAIRETSPEFFREELEDIDGALSELALLSAALEERCGAEAPSTARLRDALSSVRDTVSYVARDVLPSAPQPEPTLPAEEGEGERPAAEERRRGVGPVATREEALRMMGEVSEFFMRTEPHSPIPYLLEQATRWGAMPLPDLIREVIPDPDARLQYCKLTGIRSPEDD